MKYALLFAATAAAYDVYDGYGAQSSSIPAKVSSAPVYGAYGAQSSSIPVKVSSSAPAYGGYGDKPATSIKTTPAPSKATPCSTSAGKNGYTTITPGYGKPPVTVTSQHQAYPTCVAKGYNGNSCDKWEDDKYVSTTITDCNKKVVTVTKVQDYVTVYQEKKTITHYATPTIGAYGAASTGVWYELYEKCVEVEYQNLGKNVLVGYSGSGLCNACDDKQPVVIKEYKGGKWTEEKKEFIYGKPKDEVKTYEKTGVYTVPAKTVTIYPTETGKAYQPIVHTYEPKTITITQPHQVYTCTYEAPKYTPSKTPSKHEGYPATVTKTPTYNDYGYKASPTPKKPENNYPSYPNYGSPSNTTSVVKGYGASSTPCAESSTAVKPHYSVPVYGDNGYGAHSIPVVSSASKPVYGEHGYGAQPTPVTPSSKPAYGNNGYGGDYVASIPTPTPSAPVYGDNYKPSSTPCSDKKPTPTHSKPAQEYPAVATTTPTYNNGYGEPSKPVATPTPAQNYPADPSSGYGANTEYGKTNAGYTKRAGIIERRKAVAEAQKAKRAISL